MKLIPVVRIFLLIGCLIVAGFQSLSMAEGLEAKSREQAVNEEGKLVSTSSLDTIAVFPSRSAPAEVLSLNQPVLSAQLNAQVKSIAVNVGDRVQRDQLLLQLDCRDFEVGLQAQQARFNSQQARVTLAQQRFDRTLQLVEQGLAPIETLDIQRADLDVAKSDLSASKMDVSIAKLQVSRCDIRAPMAALVLDRMASVGQLATVGTRLIEIIDLDNLDVSAQVFAGDTPFLTADIAVYLQANGHEYPLAIRHILPSINPATRNQEVRLDFTAKPAVVGAAGKIVWQDPRPHLPANLLVKRNGQFGFFVAEKVLAKKLSETSYRAKFIELPTAKQGRANVIDSPLYKGEQVIVKGYLDLSASQLLLIED